MPRPDERDFLRMALQNNMAAVAFCECLFRVSQTWDDLIDQDKEVSKNQINSMMWEALVVLPSNPFYQRWQHELQPLLKAFILDWIDATTLESTDDHGKNIAFVLRDSVGAVVSHCAYLIGGYDWMVKVSPDVRRHIFEEKLEDYKQKLEVTK